MGGLDVDGGGALSVDRSSIDSNTVSLANSIASPYPDQAGATDNENAFTGGVYLADGSTATINDSSLDGNAVEIHTTSGQAYGGDVALCACGDVPLTLKDTRIEVNMRDG